MRSEVDNQATLNEIEKLIESQPGTSERDRMDVLVTLIEAYEAKTIPIPKPDDLVQVLVLHGKPWAEPFRFDSLLGRQGAGFRSAQPQTRTLF
jgi:hypothetical protein